MDQINNNSYSHNGNSSWDVSDIGPWAIAPDFLMQALAASTRGSQFISGIPARTQGNVSVISLDGPLSRGGTFAGGTATSSVVESLRSAAANPAIKGVLLKVNSPGGYVAGTKELADTVAEVAQSKPVYAAIQDIGASAAYWAASQATRVYAAPDALVGSIGTVAVIPDMSSAAEKAGIKVHVLRSSATSEHKGAGTPGAPVTDTQLAEMQRILTAKNEFFTDAVSAGRGINATQLSQVADGRLFLASEAKDLGLVDQVATTEQAMQDLMAVATAASTSGGHSMSQTIDAGAAAVPPTVTIPQRIAGFKAACPGATDTQLLAWVSAEANVETAQAEHIRRLEEENAALLAKVASAQAPVQQTAVATPPVAAVAPVTVQPVVIGLQPIGNADGSDTDMSATAQWQREISRLEKQGMDRRAAVLHLMQNNEQLQSEYVAERNRK